MEADTTCDCLLLLTEMDTKAIPIGIFFMDRHQNRLRGEVEEMPSQQVSKKLADTVLRNVV